MKCQRVAGESNILRHYFSCIDMHLTDNLSVNDGAILENKRRCEDEISLASQRASHLCEAVAISRDISSDSITSIQYTVKTYAIKNWQYAFFRFRFIGA